MEAVTDAEEVFICGATIHPGSFHIDPEPPEYCEVEVESRGESCPAHRDRED